MHVVSAAAIKTNRASHFKRLMIHARSKTGVIHTRFSNLECVVKERSLAEMSNHGGRLGNLTAEAIEKEAAKQRRRVKWSDKLRADAMAKQQYRRELIASFKKPIASKSMPAAPAAATVQQAAL